MSGIRLIGFSGEIPRLMPRLLPESAAQAAFNTRLESGDLRPIRKSKSTLSSASLPSVTPASIYRFDGEWLSWASNVNAAPGPVASDRLYYTGDGVPKMYTASTEYNMKIVPPSAALSATVSGTGDGDITTRIYTYTNVSEFGEESEPAPLSTPIEWQPNVVASVTGVSIANPSVLTAAGHGLADSETVTLAGFSTTPDINGSQIITVIDANSFSIPVNVTAVTTGTGTATGLAADNRPVTLSGFTVSMGDRTATYQRIYRSQTSASGDTTLYFIAERSALTTDYIDSVAVDDFGESLPSLEWNQPPDTLSGLISLPNGMMAAFVGKKLYFCEPYYPYAWPDKYILTTDYTIVGLGAYGTTLVVMTEGNPYLVSGTAPENMIMEKLELNLPCINSRGIVDLGYAIAYPSHDGLVVVSSGGARLASEALFTRTGWQTLNPDSMIAGQYDGRYIASYSYTDADGNTIKGMLIIDLTGSQPFLIRSDDFSIAFFHDITTGQLFFLDGQVIYEWDAIGQSSRIQNFKSKQFILTKPEQFGCIYIDAADEFDAEEIQAIIELRDEILAANQAIFDAGPLGGAINGGYINQYELGGDALDVPPDVDDIQISVTIYADKELVASVSEANKVKRLPSGFLAKMWEIEISSNVRVYQVEMARSASELRSI